MPVDIQNKPDRPLPEPKRFGSSLISLLTFLLLFNFFILPALRPGPKIVPYSEFLQQVKDNRVAEALATSQQIRYVLKADVKNQPVSGNNAKNPQIYETAPVADPNLVQVLEQHNVKFGAPPPLNLGAVLDFRWQPYKLSRL